MLKQLVETVKGHVAPPKLLHFSRFRHTKFSKSIQDEASKMQFSILVIP